MFEFIQEAGYGIYPVLTFGLAALFVAVRHAFTPERRHVVTVAWLMALCGVTGLLGATVGVMASASHIHEVQDKWIFLAGLHEALHNLAAATALVALSLLVMLVAHLRGAGGKAASAPVPATTTS